MKHRRFTKLLALVLALCLLAGALPLSASAAEYSGSCGANLKWEIANDTLTISGTGPMNDFPAGYSQVPWYKYRDHFTKAQVQSGVTTVGENAFVWMDQMTEVTLPDTLTSIGDYAFQWCGSLEGITIPAGVTTIGKDAFAKCDSMTYASIPEGVTTIGSGAFESTEMLTDVSIPSTVTEIGTGAFQWSGIRHASIPGGAQLGRDIFAYSDLETVELGYGITEVPNGMFFQCQNLTSVSIPGSVKVIGAIAFCDCTSLASVTIGEGLERVEANNTFDGCDSLEEITFPRSCSVLAGTPVHTSPVKYCTILNPNCQIKDDENQLGVVGVTTVRGYKGSTAEEYALKYGYAFEALEGEPEVPVSFTDVHEGDYFYQPVLWAVENDITAGTSDATFSPSQNCFREQAMMFLWKAAGKPQPTSSYNPFTDVKPDAYYYDAVLWAVEKNITSGVSDTKFGTGTPCTRGQIMTFLYKAAGSPSVSGNNPFRDVRQGDYFYSPVLWAVRNGITSGTSATEFSPAQSCTRGQIVTFLYKHYAQ